MVRAVEAPIRSLDVKVYRIPTDAPESDGTLQWDATTLVTVSCGAGNAKGIGLTYADSATAQLIADKLKALVVGRDALDIPGSWNAMVQAIRNLGRPGICSMAIAAVDNALWDLKARLLQLPLVRSRCRCRAIAPSAQGVVRREGVDVFYTSRARVMLRDLGPMVTMLFLR